MAIPRPGKIVTAKEKANLKTDAGPGRPKKTKADREGQAIAKRLVDDPGYRRTLYVRLRKGTIQPGVECLLWQMAYGKPKESVEVSGGPVAVTIIHKLRGVGDEPEPPTAKPEDK